MNVETAVIPVAGAGTRQWPVTTAIEKCLMPVYSGPESKSVVDYMVEDCALAGIKRVIFVCSERGKTQISEYFEQINQHLVEQVEGLGRNDKVDEELTRRLERRMQYEYVIQPSNRYGTAFPPFLAKEHLRGEDHFALVGGDDFIYRQDGTSELASAIKQWEIAGTDHLINGKLVPRLEASGYGILQVDEGGRLRTIDEKPPLKRLPERPIANISRYLLSKSIWPHIDEEMARNRGKGEHRITDVINSALDDDQSFYVDPVTGEYMDGGTFAGLLRASLYITEHPRAA